MVSYSISEIQNKIRENLVRIRREKGLTQEDLSLSVGLSQAFINQLETGRRKFSLAHIYMIGSVLNCSIYKILPDYKLDGDEDHDN